MTQPPRGFVLYRQSLSLPEEHWAWLETETARRRCTRSDVVEALVREAMDPKEKSAR